MSDLLSARARGIAQRLATRILACRELGIQVTRIRVTIEEWRILQEDYATRGVGAYGPDIPRTFMGYPLMVNRRVPTAHEANRRMEMSFPSWNRRERNVRGAPV
jgi:hypothetical protein